MLSQDTPRHVKEIIFATYCQAIDYTRLVHRFIYFLATILKFDLMAKKAVHRNTVKPKSWCVSH